MVFITLHGVRIVNILSINSVRILDLKLREVNFRTRHVLLNLFKSPYL